MILLDTDHLSVFLDERDSRQRVLKGFMEAAGEPVTTSIVNVEEVVRGWFAIVHRLRDVHRQLPAYERLRQFFDVLGDWELTAFDERAAHQFTILRRQRIRIGTMDLKIASISLVSDALLVTANLRDFSQVPGLRCENWLQS